jgi:hypothetical protein
MMLVTGHTAYPWSDREKVIYCKVTFGNLNVHTLQYSVNSIFKRICRYVLFTVSVIETLQKLLKKIDHILIHLWIWNWTVILIFPLRDLSLLTCNWKLRFSVLSMGIKIVLLNPRYGRGVNSSFIFNSEQKISYIMKEDFPHHMSNKNLPYRVHAISQHNYVWRLYEF